MTHATTRYTTGAQWRNKKQNSLAIIATRVIAKNVFNLNGRSLTGFAQTEKEIEMTGIQRNWFSNFLPFDERMMREYKGYIIIYHTPENFYQAMKTDNPFDRYKISRATPGRAKWLGNKVKLKPDWDNIKIEVMEYALKYKFSEGTHWHKLLMAYKSEIVEWNNWHDIYWGKCICRNCKSQGQNLLGEMLMSIKSSYL